MKVLDLFSGIGGFSLGMEKAGFETVAFCEIEKYAQKVLKKHWPKVRLYEDVREITAARLIRDGIRPDVITGGFPCQDVSIAGRQEGIEAERSGLWSECARLLGDVRPKYAVFENVTNLLNGQRGDWFKRVLWDISQVGYDAVWHCVPASSIGAPHERDRVWIIAYPDESTDSANEESKRKEKSLQGERWTQRLARLSIGTSYGSRVFPHANKAQCKGRRLSQRIQEEHANIGDTCWWEIESNVDRMANGIPSQMDRLGCLGNSVVPQIPEIIGRAIMSYEND